MTIEDFARMIAGRVFLAELCASRTLGFGEVDALNSAFGAMDETYCAVFEPDHPAVVTRFRPVCRDLASLAQQDHQETGK